MSAAVALFLAAVLALSAGHKVLARDRMIGATARLTGVTLPVATVLVAAVACIEALAALAIAIPALRQGGALAAGLVWLAYSAVLARHLGERLDCGCDLVARERTVGGVALARPLVLALLAAPVALVPQEVWHPDTPFAALAMLALWFAAGELHTIPKLARIRP